jgi:hypothetical protein
MTARPVMMPQLELTLQLNLLEPNQCKLCASVVMDGSHHKARATTCETTMMTAAQETIQVCQAAYESMDLHRSSG